MSFLIGASLALAVGVFATWVGFDRDRAFYPSVMIVIASLYVLFSVIGGSQSLLIECAVMALFVLASVAGFKRTLWLVVAALAAHGVLDFVHADLIVNPGVPVWWPAFCGAYDLVAACYLAVLLIRSMLRSPAWRAGHMDASWSGRERACGSSAQLPASNIRGRISMPITRSR